MAEKSQEASSKRKSRKSSSDESAISSPETKKLKNTDADGDSEEEDAILAALNMAEAFQKSVQDIMKRLEKLDVIETAVNNLQTSFEKLENKIQSLEEGQATNKRDIEDLKASLNVNEDDKTKLKDSLKELKDKTAVSLAALEKENGQLRNTLKEVQDKTLYLEAYSRRENIKFENIPEDTSSKEDTEMVLRSFLERVLGCSDAADIEIQRVHRLGKSKEGKPRPILARFLRYKDCEKLFSRGHRLRETNFKMYQDLPFGIVERRRAQMDTFKQAKRNNIPAAFSRAQPDKLLIRGKVWPPGMPLEP